MTRIEARPDSNGRPLLTGSVKGRTATPEALAAALAELLPEVVRQTGLGASERVERLHAQGGVRAVLDEVDRIESDSVRVTYILCLLEVDGLSEDDVNAAMRHAALRIESDWGKAEYVVAVLELPSDPGRVAAVLEVAGTIESDAYMAEALVEILDAQDVTVQTRAAALTLAGERIGSDAYLAEVLCEVSPAALREPEVGAALLEAALEIGSDAYQAEVLIEWLEHGRATAEQQLLVLKAAREGIDSDAYLAEVLSAMPPDQLGRRGDRRGLPRGRAHDGLGGLCGRGAVRGGGCLGRPAGCARDHLGHGGRDDRLRSLPGRGARGRAALAAPEGRRARRLRAGRRGDRLPALPEAVLERLPSQD